MSSGKYTELWKWKLRIRKTQHQHATDLEKDLVICRDSWVSFPLHNSLKLHVTAMGHEVPRRLQDILLWVGFYSFTVTLLPSFLPIPGKYTKHCKLVTVLSPFSLNSLNYLLPPMNTGARKTAAFKTAFLIKRWFKSFCLSLIQGSCSWQQSPRINLQNHKNIMFASALDITFAIFLSKYIILV